MVVLFPHGLSGRVGRLMAAIALLLFLFALGRAPVVHAAAVRGPVAKAAALRTELVSLDHRRAALRSTVRRSCARSTRSKTCKNGRARLAKVEARAAKLRVALRRPRSGTREPVWTSTTIPSTTAPAAPTTTTAPATTPSTTPAPVVTPTPTPVARTPLSDAPVSYQPGVVGWTSPTYDIPAAQRLGARHIRLEFPIESTVDDLAPTIGSWAAQGIQVLVLASFNGRMPTAAQARNLATWATAFGPGGTYWTTHAGGGSAPALIEFGNETSGWWQYGDTPDSASYVQRAGTYALRFKDAALAISQANRHVGLLAQADDPGGHWLDGIYAALPNFHDYVSGWIAHPYGNTWRADLRTTRNRVASHGAPASIPWDITETGVSVDDGRCVDDNYGWDACMSYTTAAATLHTIISQLRADFGDRLRSLYLYRVRDLKQPGATSAREDYFGVQTVDLQDKGAYTAQARFELAQGA